MFQVTGSSFVTVFSRHEGAWRQVDGDKIREGIAALWFTVAGRLRITNDYLAISRQSAARELNRIIKAMDKEDGEYRVDLDALLDMMRQK